MRAFLACAFGSLACAVCMATWAALAALASLFGGWRRGGGDAAVRDQIAGNWAR